MSVCRSWRSELHRRRRLQRSVRRRRFLPRQVRTVHALGLRSIAAFLPSLFNHNSKNVLEDPLRHSPAPAGPGSRARSCNLGTKRREKAGFLLLIRGPIVSIESPLIMSRKIRAAFPSAKQTPCLYQNFRKGSRTTLQWPCILFAIAGLVESNLAATFFFILGEEG